MTITTMYIILSAIILISIFLYWQLKGKILKTISAIVLSIAILIGGIGGMAPERKGDIARLGWKAIVGGTLANLLSAAIAGLLLTI